MRRILEKLPYKENVETSSVLKQLSITSRALAELKGIAKTMPNQNILINAIMINEAKASSEIENIVTSHDEIYEAMIKPNNSNPYAKEVVDYRGAIWVGYKNLEENGYISLELIKKVQEKIEHNNAGIRSTLGTVIKNTKTDEIIYTPPQTKEEILDYMNNLLNYINISDDVAPLRDLLKNLEDYINKTDDEVDPLIKMALIHYQFESIHPFYDGNGRTGRILNILYLIKENLLETPILYLSKYIINTKNEYYRLFQETRETNNYEKWIIYILKGIEETAIGTIKIINAISEEMLKVKHKLRDNTKIYSKELLEAMFYEFYTKTSYVEKLLGVSERTALRYLNTLVDKGFLVSERVGRERIYKNQRLFDIIKRFEEII